MMCLSNGKKRGIHAIRATLHLRQETYAGSNLFHLPMAFFKKGCLLMIDWLKKGLIKSIYIFIKNIEFIT